jgi:hypothetical protein
MTSSTSGGACSVLDPFAGLYNHTTKIVQGILIVTSTLRPMARSSSSSSSAAPPDPDSSDDYPEIRISACVDSIGEGHLIFMVSPIGDPSHNSSNRYLTIGGSEVSDTWTTNDGMIQNMNTDFNAIQLQTIMESTLAQQGAEVVNIIATQRSTSHLRGEPSVSNRSHDQGKRV